MCVSLEGGGGTGLKVSKYFLVSDGMAGSHHDMVDVKWGRS